MIGHNCKNETDFFSLRESEGLDKLLGERLNTGMKKKLTRGGEQNRDLAWDSRQSPLTFVEGIKAASLPWKSHQVSMTGRSICM